MRYGDDKIIYWWNNNIIYNLQPICDERNKKVFQIRGLCQPYYVYRQLFVFKVRLKSTI